MKDFFVFCLLTKREMKKRKRGDQKWVLFYVCMGKRIDKLREQEQRTRELSADKQNNGTWPETSHPTIVAMPCERREVRREIHTKREKKESKSGEGFKRTVMFFISLLVGV